MDFPSPSPEAQLALYQRLFLGAIIDFHGQSISLNGNQFEGNERGLGVFDNVIGEILRHLYSSSISIFEEILPTLQSATMSDCALSWTLSLPQFKEPVRGEYSEDFASLMLSSFLYIAFQNYDGSGWKVSACEGRIPEIDDALRIIADHMKNNASPFSSCTNEPLQPWRVSRLKVHQNIL